MGPKAPPRACFLKRAPQSPIDMDSQRKDKGDRIMDFQRNNGTEKIKWPYKVDYDKVTHISLDVLVVGGGLAGSFAGIHAAQNGAITAVVDKAPIKRSGNGGAGMDHWNTLLNHPDSPMTPEENLARTDTRGRQGHRDYIAIKGTYDTLMELEKFGLPIRDLEGDFADANTLDKKTKLLKAYDYSNLIAVKLKGGQFLKPVLYEELLRSGVKLYERVMITSLLTEDGKQKSRVVGATGFSLETGEFFVFHAKAVVLASGYVCSVWTFSTEMTGNSYRWDPNEIGEGFAMVWNAGGEVVNMHKNGSTNAGAAFAWPRFGIGNPSNTWFPCSIVDNNGKEIPWEDIDGNILTSAEARNYPAKSQVYMGSGASDKSRGIKTPNLIHDLPERIDSGEYELPLWADLPSMPEDERRSIWGMMIGNEGKTRYTLYDLYTREGFNPDKDMLMAPIMHSKSYLSGGWFHGEPDVVKPWRVETFGAQGEPAVDWNMMTTIPGLFCAGATSGLEGCSFACSTGAYTGDRVAEYVKGIEPGKVDELQLEKERKRVYAPVERYGNEKAYISWKELWSGSARAMQQCCSEIITKPVLNQGLIWLESIKKNEMKKTYARNPHELARVLECETRITCSEAFIRGGISRLEEEEKGNINSDTLVFNSYTNGKMNVRLDADKYWLRGAYEDDYLKNYEKITGKRGQNNG